MPRPSALASSSRQPVGVWQLVRIVSRPEASTEASVVRGSIEAGMVLAVEPGCYWPEGGGLRVEDNFLITADGPHQLSPFPDGIVSAGT